MKTFVQVLGVATCVAWAVACDASGSSSNEGDRPGGKTDDVADEQRGCRVFVHERLGAAFEASQDPFRQKVLGDADCRRSEDAVLARDLATMLHDGGCSLMGRALISEEAQVVAAREGEAVFARGFDVWNCEPPGSFEFEEAKGKIYVGNFGNDPEHSGYEIIAFDRTTGTANFYTNKPGPNGDADFVFNGNSFLQAPEGLSGFPGSHPCTNCHAGGGLLIKETRFPWVNWHSHLTMPFLDVQGVATRMLADGMPAPFAGIGSGSPPKGVLIAEHVETLTLATAVEVNKAKIARLRAGEPFDFPHEAGEPRPFTIADLMRPMLCEEEISLATSIDTTANFDAATPSLPKDLFLNRLLQPLRSSTGETVLSIAGEQRLAAERPGSRLDTTGFNDSQDFLDALVRVGSAQLRVDNNVAFPTNTVRWGPWTAFLEEHGVIAEAGVGGSQPFHRFGRVPFLIPARSFADDDFVSRLVNEGVVEETLVRAALLVDFSNPVFSRRRCQLLDVMPRDEVAGRSPEAITAAVDAALAASSEPAAAEMRANLGAEPAELAQRVMAYRNACRDATFDDHAALLDLLRGKQVRLLAEAERFAIEHHVFKMFPEVEKDDERAFVSEHLDKADVGLDGQCRIVGARAR